MTTNMIWESKQNSKSSMKIIKTWRMTNSHTIWKTTIRIFLICQISLTSVNSMMIFYLIPNLKYKKLRKMTITITKYLKGLKQFQTWSMNIRHWISSKIKIKISALIWITFCWTIQTPKQSEAISKNRIKTIPSIS